MTHEKQNRTEQKKIESTASFAGSIVGGITSTVINNTVGGPIGSLIGLFAGSTFQEVAKYIVEDFSQRYLSSREKDKIKIIEYYTSERVKELEKEGKLPRNDWFDPTSKTGRSKAHEIFEEALFKAKKEPQEEKIRFFGYFLANISFDTTISPEIAHLFFDIAEKLSYRQFCFLALIEKIGVLDVEPMRGRIHHNLELEILKREEMKLHLNDFGDYGLIEDDGSGYDGGGNFGYNDRLSEVGKLFCTQFELSKISNIDIDKLVELLYLCQDSHEKPPLLPARNILSQAKKIDELKNLF